MRGVHAGAFQGEPCFGPEDTEPVSYPPIGLHLGLFRGRERPLLGFEGEFIGCGSGFRFQQPVEVSCSVQDADDLDAVGDGPVEDEVLLETLDTPDPQSFQAWIGRRSPFADAGMRAICSNDVAAAS
jgi:hypothetical protein